jgi:hypothetical protein
MTLKLRHLAVLAFGLAAVSLFGTPASAHPQYGYGYYPQPYPYPRGHGEVVIIQPPVRYAPPPVYYAPPPPVYYAPPPVYYAPPPAYYAPAPYPRYGHYGRPGVSLNFRF